MQLQFDMASVSHTHLQPHIYTDMLCTFWVVSVFETMVKCTDSPYLAELLLSRFCSHFAAPRLLWCCSRAPWGLYCWLTLFDASVGLVMLGVHPLLLAAHRCKTKPAHLSSSAPGQPGIVLGFH